MSDMYCVHCGDPWESYFVLTEMREELGGYKSALEKFKTYGCGMFNERVCTHAPILDEAQLNDISEEVIYYE